MNFLNALRRSSLPWAGPVLLGIALFYAFTWRIRATGFGGDTVFVMARALGPIPGALAGVAAWEAGRLRAGHVWRLTPSLGRYRVAFDALRLVLFLAVLLDAVVLVAASVRVSALPRFEDLPQVASLLAVQCGAVIVGFGAGCLLPRALAAPVVLVVLSLWTMIPATLEATPWLRHLNGLPSDAATVTDSIAPQALLAPALLAAGAVAGVLLASVPWRSRLLRGAAAVCCVVAGAVPAQAMVADAGYRMPTVPRDGAQVCEEGAPRICVPKEFADALPRLRKAAETALPRLAAVGLRKPDTLAYVSLDAPVTSGTWRLHLEKPVTEARALSAVATAPVPVWRYGACPKLRDDVATPSPGPVTAWLRLAAGTDERGVKGDYDAATVRRVAEVRRKPPAAQKAWADRQIRALRSCDPKVHAEALR
ncbi:hypothetical protein [Streptomyces sp. NPDC003077]|uniref:DUF7224 domain-containing protein n=1 Tax=Streptomyces sp. NPDC003077 TaxID=3154443 RepID=UPI0033B7996D